MKTEKHPKNKGFTAGFTLVEMLVAVSIFSLSVLALLSVLSQGISDTNYTKKKVIAAYLAAEGIEYMRNLRDTYALFSSSAQDGWNDFNVKLLSSACAGANGCYFNPSSLDFSSQDMPITSLAMAACTPDCPALLYDEATGRYGYDSGADSGYVRKIQITRTNADETKVSTTVFWQQNSGTYQITFTETLFNWME